jgi:hypothetical protein
MTYSDYLAYLDKLKDPNSDIYDIDLYDFYTNDERNFFIYDDNKQLKFSKLNFNLGKFNTSAEIKQYLFGPTEYVKIFKKFLELNMGDVETYITKPYKLLPKYVQYFDPIKPEMIDYLNYYGTNAHVNALMYVDAPPGNRIIDWLRSNNDSDFLSHSKYNLDYERFSADFKIYGSKLLIFCDFFSRNYISPIPSMFDIYEPFYAYFNPVSSEMKNYMLTVGLFSGHEFTERSDKNIDYEYFKNSPKNKSIIDMLKIQYSDFNLNSNKYIFDYINAYGQFEMIDLAYKSTRKSPLDLIKKAVCTVYLNTSEQSHSTCGFLYKKNNDIFVVTSYDIILHKPSAERIYCLFENEVQNQLIEFRIIGFDKVSNVLMAIYNPNAQYNINRNITLDHQIFVGIDTTDFNNLGAPVYVIGNMEENDNLTTLSATVMKTNYGGGFTINASNEIMPSSIVVNSYFYETCSGSPIFASTDLNDISKFRIVGILTKMFAKANSNYAIGLTNIMVELIIASILTKWRNVLSDYPNIENMSNNIIDAYIRNGFPKAWLGINGMYYNHNSKFVFPELNNFPWIGGLIVRNIINGYDTIKNIFIYDGSQNSNKAIIKLHSPLENTKIHKRIVETGIPIVIKSIKFINMVTDEPMNMYIGKYGSQKSYSEYVYGQQYYDTASIPKSQGTYNNQFIYLFNPITIEYYHYNGKNWTSETLDIGSNDPSFFVDYANNDVRYRQNKFEYPEILYNYQKFYNINF